jgi:hypothetical protein
LDESEESVEEELDESEEEESVEEELDESVGVAAAGSTTPSVLLAFALALALGTRL